jgi:hypothetical protein
MQFRLQENEFFSGTVVFSELLNKINIHYADLATIMNEKYGGFSESQTVVDFYNSFIAEINDCTDQFNSVMADVEVFLDDEEYIREQSANQPGVFVIRGEDYDIGERDPVIFETAYCNRKLKQFKKKFNQLDDEYRRLGINDSHLDVGVPQDHTGNYDDMFQAGELKNNEKRRNHLFMQRKHLEQEYDQFVRECNDIGYKYTLPLAIPLCRPEEYYDPETYSCRLKRAGASASEHDYGRATARSERKRAAKGCERKRANVVSRRARPKELRARKRIRRKSNC